MLNCRKIRAHCFIFFGENGPDRNIPPADSARPEDMKALEKNDSKDKIERNDSPEEVAKKIKSLEVRHLNVGIRIDNAKAKYEKCMNIAKKLPEGSGVRNTAEEACDKAKDKLVRIDRIFPKTIDLNSSSKDSPKPEATAKPAPTAEQKLDTVLDKSSSQTGTVMKELSATEKVEMEAKKMIDSLKKFGIKDETINKIFKENPAPEDVLLNIKDLQSLQISGMEDNFKKIVESVNANGNFDTFSSSLNALAAGSLKPQQIVNILSRGDVCSGSMKVAVIVKYLKSAQANKFDTDFAISVIDKVDLKKDIEPQLNKLQYFSKLQDSFKAQGIDLAEKTMGDLYGKEKNADTVLSFFERVKDLSPNMVDKIALFLVESDPVKAREVFSSVKDKADVKGALEEKELADYKSKYPYINSGYFAYAPSNPDGTEESLRFGRLIDNHPGLYAFMANEISKAKNGETSQAEFESFAKDPSLPLAYRIYIKLDGPVSGKLTFATSKIERCLNLARTFHEKGAKPSEIDAMSKEQVEQEFDKLNNLAEQKGDINLYTYPATDESGNVIKNPDGSVKMLSRELVFVANYENNHFVNGFVQGNVNMPHFFSDEIFNALGKSGAKFDGQMKDKSGNPMIDRNGNPIWENAEQKKDEKGNPVVDEKGNPVWENNGKPKNVFAASNQDKFDSKAVPLEANIAELQKLKHDILSRIENAQPPMTMCFNGHGGGNGGLVLADLPAIKGPDGKMKINPDSSISAEDLSKAIKARSEKFKGNPNLSKDIYLFSACATHEMVQDVLKRIKDDNSVQPIISGATGHGINLVDAGSTGANFVMGQPNAKVRDLLAANSDDSSGNHGFTYVPDAQGRAAQITRFRQALVAKAPAPDVKPS